MRVLFFTHHYLDGNSGGSFASRAYINAFAEIADSCMLMYPDRGIPIDQYIHKKCVLKGVGNNRNNIQKVVDIYNGRLHRYYDVMIPQIKEYKPDIVVFDNSRTTAGMLQAVKDLGVKTVTIHHNYEIEYYQGTKPFIAWRMAFMHYMEKAEGNAVRNSDLNLTLTEEDIQLLQKHYDPEKKSKIAKLGSFESTPVTETKKSDYDMHESRKNPNPNLCFAITGTLGSFQTEVSVLPFLENIYPELLKILPNSKLIVAGRDPSAAMQETCAKYPSVLLVANPENMQDIMTQADVYICPTCVGGGLKLRVMDGFKAGLPVLTHAVSARGYEDFAKAKSMFVYDDKESFTKGLKTLLKELDKGNLDHDAVKKVYNSVFSFEAGVARLRKILTDNQLI